MNDENSRKQINKFNLNKKWIFFSSFAKLKHANGLSRLINRQIRFVQSNTTLKHFDLSNKSIFKEICTNEVTGLFKLFEKHNYELRIAGGAVRDLLLDVKPHDIDFATNATPEKMLKIFKKRVHVLHLKGLKHGTAPIRMNNVVNFDVTSLHYDVNKNGSLAEGEFFKNNFCRHFRKNINK